MVRKEAGRDGGTGKETRKEAAEVLICTSYLNFMNMSMEMGYH